MQRNDRRDIVDDSPMTRQSGYEPAADYGHTSDAEGVGKQARQAATKAREKAQEQAEAGIDTAAEGLSSAADKIRERAAGVDGMPAQAGTKVADTMERTAGYLREHDTNEIVDDLERYVREHPVQAVAGAIVGGFVIGRILK
jgi:ElaB/YqjD/DUF883 family membrane-anchored ribosome-binding protein